MWSEQKVLAYSNDPLLWVRENFQLTRGLHPWQEQFFHDLALYDYFALKSGNGVGKTATLALTVLWILTTKPMVHIQCTAPSEPQLFQGLWAEISKWLGLSYNLRNYVDWTQTKISMKGFEADWWAIARTAQSKHGSQSSESLQGVHAENNAAIIDEASGVEEGSTAAVLGILATGKSKVIMAGNPIRKSGLFFDAFNKLQHMFRTYTIPSNDYEKLNKALVNTNFIEFIRGIYGENSPAWYFKVLGEFPIEDSYEMFSPEKLEKLYAPDVEIPVGRAYIGADISDGGDCESVFTVRIGNVLVEQRSFKSLDTEANADALEMLIHEYDPMRVNVDSVGVGSGVVSVLRRRGHKNIHGVQGQAVPSEVMYLNTRSELYFKAAWLVRNEVIKTKFPCERLKGDLSEHYQEPRDDGKFAVIGKAKLRKAVKVENSPDFSDSFVYSLYGDRQLLVRQKLGTGEQSRILEVNKKLHKPKSTMVNLDWASYNRNSRFDF